MLGWTDEQITRKPLISFIHPDDHDPFHTAFSQLHIPGQPSGLRLDLQMLTHANTYKTIQWQMTSGAEGATLWVGKDITEERHQAEMMEKLQTKNRLFAIIAHDMRNFMGQSKVMSQMLKELIPSDSSAKLNKAADQNFRTSRRLFFLLENLLAWTQDQEGQLQWRPSAIHLQTWIEEQVALFQPLAELKQIQLQLGKLPDYTFEGDVQIISVILRNLLSNALKFTKSDGKIRIFAQEREGHQWIRIEDNGIGIPQEDLSSILDLKKKKVRSGTARESGSGLGLQLVQDMLALYDGDLCIKSNEGKGSIISFRLPNTKSVANQNKTVQSVPSAQLIR